MNRSVITTRAGFTLVEMLVVISIITIVLALSFPMIGAMRRDSSASSAVNTISVAIPSIRRYATGAITFSSDLIPDDPGRPATLGTQRGLYSGAAAIFTPAGEIRLTRNTAGAASSDLIIVSATDPTLLELRGPRRQDQQTGINLPQRELNGFRDLEVDYLKLPSDTGIAGINRVSGGALLSAGVNDPPLLLAPPFAVWFSQNGYLISTGWDLLDNQPNDYQFVYYDGNYDGDYETFNAGSLRREARTSRSGNEYWPDDYNPDSGDFDPGNWNDAANKYELPFEMLEAVTGVYVYSREAFQSANDRWADGETDPQYAAPPWHDTTRNDNDARWKWMKENGEMLMFSKQTGAMMRNRDE